MTIAEWVTMVAAILAAVLTEYNRIRTKAQLDVIHRDTNGNLSALKTELAMERHSAAVRPRV